MNHWIFERKWRSWVLPGACLSECRILSNALVSAVLRCHGVLASIKSPCPLKDSSIGLAFSIETWVRRLKIIFSFAQTCNSRNKVQSKRWQTINIKSWPQIRQGYPLNLSILISGGKETNKDSLSNGEWSGNSSNLKSPTLASANCSCEKHFLGGSVVPKLLGTVRHRGWQPRLWLGRPLTMCFRRVGLFGNAAQKWW